jgi:protein-S-isoprenylcysteine O-methyltransferase Ste14
MWLLLNLVLLPLFFGVGAATVIFGLAGRWDVWNVWAYVGIVFFSPVVRIQAERGQRVISAGPYRIVRHPGYAGFLLWAVASGVALNSLLSIIPMVVIALPITVYQTMIEDRMLHAELAGYADYAAKVRYRLIPDMW